MVKVMKDNKAMRMVKAAEERGHGMLGVTLSTRNGYRGAALIFGQTICSCFKSQRRLRL